jgi:3'-5' exonuclease
MATQYIVFDTESIPDGKLLRLVKYHGEERMTDEEAVDRTKADALEASSGKSDFISPVYQIPVAVALAKVDESYLIEDLVLLDSPDFRPKEIAAGFWKGVSHYKASLVSFNGRGFDLPLLEAAAFRYGVSIPYYYSEYGLRHRYAGKHIDLMDWLTNYGALKQGYSLDLFSKLIGKPGKMTTRGSDVCGMHAEGRIREINEYCTYDVLDTYFVFLRYLVMLGKINIDEEGDIVRKAKNWIEKNTGRLPFLQKYMDNWGDWTPWP